MLSSAQTKDAEMEFDDSANDPDLARRAAAAARALADGAAAASTTGQFPPEPGAVRVLRAAVRMLPEAVHDAELKHAGEFHALFQLMLGMGVDPATLAERLEVGPATITRYAAGTSAPATIHARRGALVETARLVEQGMRGGTLQCLMHLPRG